MTMVIEKKYCLVNKQTNKAAYVETIDGKFHLVEESKLFPVHMEWNPDKIMYVQKAENGNKGDGSYEHPYVDINASLYAAAVIETTLSFIR